MISILSYWPQDPNGWLRHLIVGLVMGAILIRFRLGTIWFWFAVCIAIGKELTDAFIEWADIILTLSGISFPKIISKWQTVNH